MLGSILSGQNLIHIQTARGTLIVRKLSNQLLDAEIWNWKCLNGWWRLRRDSQSQEMIDAKNVIQWGIGADQSHERIDSRTIIHQRIICDKFCLFLVNWGRRPYIEHLWRICLKYTSISNCIITFLNVWRSNDFYHPFYTVCCPLSVCAYILLHQLSYSASKVLFYNFP